MQFQKKIKKKFIPQDEVIVFVVGGGKRFRHTRLLSIL
jgi:hypothetical protein